MQRASYRARPSSPTAESCVALLHYHKLKVPTMKRIAALAALAFLVSITSYAQGLDISGWKVIQANASGTFVVPNGTVIAPGGYVIIARNAVQASFETFWGKKLDASCVFLNTVDASGSAPKINGLETFTLQNAAGLVIDGPTVGLPTPLSGRTVYQRKSGSLAAGVIGSWNVGTDATPGSGMTSSATGKVVVSEIGDDAGTGNFAYEFVELFYDVAAPATGEGTATIAPARFAYNQPASVQIALTAEADTIRGIRCVKPSIVNWSMPTISVLSPAPVIVVTGDTLNITNLAIPPAGTATVSLPGITTADTTTELTFSIATTIDGAAYSSIKVQPKTIVYGTAHLVGEAEERLGHSFLPRQVGGGARRRDGGAGIRRTVVHPGCAGRRGAVRFIGHQSRAAWRRCHRARACDVL